MKTETVIYKSKEDFLVDWQKHYDEIHNFIAMLDSKEATGAMRSAVAINKKMQAWADSHDRTWWKPEVVQ